MRKIDFKHILAQLEGHIEYEYDDEYFNHWQFCIAENREKGKKYYDDWDNEIEITWDTVDDYSNTCIQKMILEWTDADRFAGWLQEDEPEFIDGEDDGFEYDGDYFDWYYSIWDEFKEWYINKNK
jgi:hypothetical protein